MTKASGVNAPRFAGLQAALKEMSRPVSGERIAAIKRGDASPAPAPTVAPRAAAAETKLAAPAKTKAAKQPTAVADNRAWQVPAEIAARGEAKAAAFRMGFEATTDKLRRAAALPAAKGRIASVIEMVAAGADDAEIKSSIASRPTDRERAATRTWERAIKSTCGFIVAGDPGVDQPEPRGAARKRMLAVATDPAFVGNEAQALMFLTRSAAYAMSADDIIDMIGGNRGSNRGAKAWDRAIAAVCN